MWLLYLACLFVALCLSGLLVVTGWLFVAPVSGWPVYGSVDFDPGR